MASREKRARPFEGFYRTIEEGIELEDDEHPKKTRKSTPTVDKKLSVTEDEDKDHDEQNYSGSTDEYDEDDELQDCNKPLPNNNISRIRQRFSCSDVSLQDRSCAFFDRLARKIKQSLFSTIKDSPEVRIEEVCDQDIYDVHLKPIGVVKKCKRKQIHYVNSVKDANLTTLLGEKWYERILNQNGDFCYVFKGTIQFWLHQKPAIKEFISVDGELQETKIENDLVLVFTFVRGDGNARHYHTDTWK